MISNFNDVTWPLAVELGGPPSDAPYALDTVLVCVLLAVGLLGSLVLIGRPRTTRLGMWMLGGVMAAACVLTLVWRS